MDSSRCTYVRVESGERASGRAESGERRVEREEQRVESGEWREKSGERKAESGEWREKSGERKEESGEWGCMESTMCEAGRRGNSF